MEGYGKSVKLYGSIFVIVENIETLVDGCKHFLCSSGSLWSLNLKMAKITKISSC